jgi:hypothetical protein
MVASTRGKKLVLHLTVKTSFKASKTVWDRNRCKLRGKSMKGIPLETIQNKYTKTNKIIKPQKCGKQTRLSSRTMALTTNFRAQALTTLLKLLCSKRELSQKKA